MRYIDPEHAMKREILLTCIISTLEAANSIDAHSGTTYEYAEYAFKEFIRTEYNRSEAKRIHRRMEMDWSAWGCSATAIAQNMLQEMDSIAACEEFTPRFGEEPMKDLDGDLEQPELPYATYCMNQYGDLGIRNDVMTNINYAIMQGHDQNPHWVY